MKIEPTRQPSAERWCDFDTSKLREIEAIGLPIYHQLILTTVADVNAFRDGLRCYVETGASPEQILSEIDKFFKGVIN